MKSDHTTSPLIPGFDFLKTLASQAGKGIEGLNQLNNLGQGLSAGINGLNNLSNLGNISGLGGFTQWVAPTLDPDELEKRIEELRTVQFWLEQNARMLGATIQALEVQKMTLSTLRSMNVKMPDLQQVLGATRTADKAGKTGQATAASAEAAAGLVDPMKWWGALTEQFQSLATQALAAAPGMAPGTGAAKGGARSRSPGDPDAVTGQMKKESGTSQGSPSSSSPDTEKPPRARKTSGTRSTASRAKPRAT